MSDPERQIWPDQDGRAAGAGPQVALHQLQSHSQEELLNAIDKLRGEHINDAELAIPQIVVCGDQSSGKSSVLEAIAGVHFPIGTETVTRFATEIVLRRAKDTKTKVSLRASTDRMGDQKAQVESFRPSFEIQGPSDCGKIIKEAGEYVRKYEPNREIWNDMLRLEISGPDKEHLTLVDLPGLVHVGTNNTYKTIRALVNEYLNNERTVVLAVFNAAYDLSLQEIQRFIQSSNKVRSRTLGIITRADCLTVGSDLEKGVIRLAKGERLPLGYGWHVVRNLAHEEENRSMERRDNIERAFFSSGAWASVSREDVGIRKLREKLSERLFGCIATELPAMITELEVRLKECKATSDRLGVGRETADKQRHYLWGVLSKLQRLVEASLDGDYEGSEFQVFFSGDAGPRLRAVVRMQSTQFTNDMHDNAHQFNFRGQGQVRNTALKLPDGAKPNFFHPYTVPNAFYNRPIYIEFSQYCDALADHMDHTGGATLRGMLPPKVATTVFRQQSIRWGPIAERYFESCYNAVTSFMKAAVHFVAGKHTSNKLMSEYVYPALEEKHFALKKKAEELLWPYTIAQPTTFSRKYDATLQKGTIALSVNASGSEEKTLRTWKGAAEHFGSPERVQTAAHALDYALAYYDVALDTFVENCTMLAVEACLLNQLPALADPEEAWRLDEIRLAKVAAEPAEDHEERTRTQAQIGVLEDVIRVCRRHARDKSSSDTTDAHTTIFPGNSTTSTWGATAGQPTSIFSGVAQPAQNPDTSQGAQDIFTSFITGKLASGQPSPARSPFGISRDSDSNMGKPVFPLSDFSVPAFGTKSGTTAGASMFGQSAREAASAGPVDVETVAPSFKLMDVSEVIEDVKSYLDGSGSHTAAKPSFGICVPTSKSGTLHPSQETAKEPGVSPLAMPLSRTEIEEFGKVQGKVQFQSLYAYEAFRGKSFEEIRLADNAAGRHGPTGSGEMFDSESSFAAYAAFHQVPRQDQSFAATKNELDAALRALDLLLPRKHV